MTERAVIEYTCNLCGMLVISAEKPTPRNWIRINNPVENVCQDRWSHICEKCMGKIHDTISPNLPARVSK